MQVPARALVASLAPAVFLAAVLGAVLGNLVSEPVPTFAETAASSDDVVVVTGNYKSQSHDLVWVIDTKIDRLLVYELQGRALHLAAARNIEWDLKLREYGTAEQVPKVSKVRKDTTGRPNPPMGTRKLVAVTGNANSGTRDLLHLYDTQSQRLVIYEYNNGSLDIVAARQTTYDLKLDEWVQGNQFPSVADVRKRVLEGEAKEEGKGK